MNNIPELILNVVMAAVVLFAVRGIRSYSLGRRLAAIGGVLILFAILFNLPQLVKGLLSAVLVIVTLRKATPTHASKRPPHPPFEKPMAPPPITITEDEKNEEKEEEAVDDEGTTITLSELNDGFDSDDITMSYAHPNTGVMHVDAALNVYTSHLEEAVKARARRIIVAHMIKTAAFATSYDTLDKALKEVITCNDPLTMQTTLQMIPEQLTLATAQSEAPESTKLKVLTILDGMQVITEDPNTKSQLQGVAETVKQSE